MGETVKITLQGKEFDSGWPVAPAYPCDKDGLGLPVGEVKCHLRLGPGPMVCVYEPGNCPFFGRYPKLRG